MTNDFWGARVGSQTQAPAVPQGGAEAYREHMARLSGSAIYRQPDVAHLHRPEYVNATRRLEDYASAPVRSKFEQQPGQSDQAYVSKLKPLLQHLNDGLPADELARVADQYNAAIERIEGGAPSHADLRSQIDSRTSGSGIGILPAASERAAILGGRFRDGEQRLAAHGHLRPESLAAKTPLSSVQVAQVIRDRESLRQQPSTTIPTGSSGEGWTVSRG